MKKYSEEEVERRVDERITRIIIRSIVTVLVVVFLIVFANWFERRTGWEFLDPVVISGTPILICAIMMGFFDPKPKPSDDRDEEAGTMEPPAS